MVTNDMKKELGADSSNASSWRNILLKKYEAFVLMSRYIFLRPLLFRYGNDNAKPRKVSRYKGLSNLR